MKIRAAVILLGLVLSACENMDPAIGRPPELTFEHVPAIRLNVKDIEVKDTYRPPMQAPHVEHLLESPLYDAVHRLAEHQLTAAGTGDRLVVAIEDAGIISKKLPLKNGVEGALTHEASERYDGRVVVRVDYYRDGAPEARAGYVEATAERSVMLYEDMTPAERERLLFDVTEGLANDIARSIDAIMRDKLSEIIL